MFIYVLEGLFMTVLRKVKFTMKLEKKTIDLSTNDGSKPEQYKSPFFSILLNDSPGE
jgi:hypothetical protein